MKTYRIVLADDHVLIRHGIKNILHEDPAFQVVAEVGNGEELLTLLKEDIPDLLILGVSMPKMSGI